MTAAQAALMVLKALGYFQYSEDFGDDWQVATVRQASYIALFDNINANAETPLTRNQVAQLVLNALKSDMVEFTGDVGSQINLNGNQINIGYRAEYTSKTNSNSKYNAIVSGKTDIAQQGQYYVQLGEELYNGKLKLRDSTDVFGRPAHTWSYDGEEVGTYADFDLLVAEYTTAVTGKELYEVIGKTAFDKYDFSSYVDGDDVDAVYNAISKNNKNDVANTADGALTQVFVNTEDETVVITIINTYLAQATADYNAKKDEVSLTVYGINGSKKVYGEDFAIEDVEEDDFFLVTYADDEIQTIADVEVLSDVEISTFSVNSSGTVTAVTVDGTKYNDSAKLTYDTTVLTSYTNSNLKDTTYNVYLDKYGYVIGVDIVDEVKNYVFITGVDSSNSYLSTKNYEANAIFTDGTSAVIDVKNNGVLNANGGAVINTWYTYTKNSSGVYTLKAIPTAISNTADVAQSHHNATRNGTTLSDNVIDSKHVSLKVEIQNDGTSKKAYGNDDTIYLLAELDKVTSGGTDYAVIKDVDEVVTGVDNASFEIYTLTDSKNEVNSSNTNLSAANTSSGVYVLYDEDYYVIAAVVVGESDSVSENIAYIIGDRLEDESYNTATEEWTWTRKAIINGESVILTEVGDSDNSVLENYNVTTSGRWVTVKYDADGNVKKLVPYSSETSYATTIAGAVALVEADEDTVVVHIANVTHDYTLKNRTLYDSTTQKEGFLVATDVNIVLKQTTKNKNTTEYYTGWSQLKSLLDELNSSGSAHDYDFNAVIEDGRATSVIIIDNLGDGSDLTGPSGSNSSDVATLSAANNAGTVGAKIELKANATVDTDYDVDLYMVNGGTWTLIDTVSVTVNAGVYYGFTPITGLASGQQYKLVCGDLSVLFTNP